MKKIACIGNFDGVHLGHQLLINRVVELAKNDYIPTVITFDPDPEEIFTNKKKKYLTTINQKKEYFYQFGIREVIIIPFNKELSLLKKEQFMELYLNKFSLETLICGKDFKFGHLGKGDSTYLKNTNIKNFKVEVLNDVLYNNEKISSTLISNLIKEGNIKLAKELLNHEYSIEAEILNKKIITDNVIPLNGKYDVLINSSKLSFVNQTVDFPNNKKVNIVFI